MTTISDIIKGVRTASELLLKNSHHYYCFALISQGTEFLGAVSKYINDGVSLRNWNNNGEKYRYAVKKYFPAKYKQYLNKKKVDLYTQLRCGPTHAFCPGKGVALTTVNDASENEKHLEYCTYNDGTMLLIIVAEKYFEDFSIACDKVMQELTKSDKNVEYIKIRSTNSTD